MRRRLAIATSALGLAAVAAGLTTTTVAATSDARLAAAAKMARQVGHHGLYGPAPDRALVLGAWRDAGVDIRGLSTPADLLHACTWLDLRAPRPAGPAPGDYALYRDTSGVDRIGMFLSPVDVAVVDQGAVSVVPPAELGGDIGDAPVPRLLAEAGSFRPCRLPAQRWPGGRDDTSVGTGRIALADPEQVAEHLSWAAAHPRDADTGLLHPVERILGAFAAGLVGVLTQLIGDVLILLHAALERMGPVGAPFLFLGGLLGRSFDGRRLHAVLTAVMLAGLAVLLGVGAVLPFGWVVLGAVLAGAAASHAGLPVLGAVGGALVGGAFAVASFLTGLLTGVDNSDRVCVGTVLFALVSDLLWVRPALAALGLASHVQRLGPLAPILERIHTLPVLRHIAGDGRSILDISSTVGDAMALRPHAMLATAHAMRAGEVVRASEVVHDGTSAARALGAAPPLHHALSGSEAIGAMARRGVDLASLAWRPNSISSDLVGHAADALHLLDTELRTGLPSLPGLRRMLLAMDPEQRELVLGALQHASTHAVPQMQITARLSHLHSGARTLTNIATGRPQTGWWRVWRSPVVQRLLHGLPAG